MGLDMLPTVYAEGPDGYEELADHLKEIREVERIKHFEEISHISGINRPGFRFFLKEKWFSPEQKQLLIEFARNNPHENCLKPLYKSLSDGKEVELYRINLALKTIENISKFK